MLQALQLTHAGSAYILALVYRDALCVITKHAGRRILFQNDGAAVHIDLEGVFFPDIQRAPQFNGQNNPPKLIHLTYNSGRFQLTHFLSAQRTPAFYSFSTQLYRLLALDVYCIISPFFALFRVLFLYRLT